MSGRTKEEILAYHSKDVAKLASLLDEIHKSPNVMTLATFKRLSPLFRRNTTVDDATMERLGREYLSMVDLYKETVVVRSDTDRTVLLTLPPIFMEVKSIPNTPENDELVMVNTNMALNASAHHQNRAFASLTHAVVKTQLSNKEAILAARARYREIMEQFNGKVKPRAALGDQTPKPEEREVSADDVVEGWEFD